MQTGASLQLILIILCSFFYSLIAVSAVSVQDPENELKRISIFKSPGLFQEQFVCNQQFNFFLQTGHCRIECDEFICKEKCTNPGLVEAVFQVEECTENSVQVYSSRGQAWELTQDRFKQSQGTVALDFIQNIDLFYEPIDHVKISQVIYPLPRKMIENGKMLKLMTVGIYFTGYVDSAELKQSQTFILELDLSRKGLDQLMYLSSSESGQTQTDYLFKRKGFFNGIP